MGAPQRVRSLAPSVLPRGRAGAAITFATVSSPFLPKAPQGASALALGDLWLQSFCFLVSTFFFFFFFCGRITVCVILAL